METREITINEKDLLAAYRAGNADQKAVLEELYGKEIFEYDWREITSYEKACEVLGIRQIRIGETGDRPQYMRMANAMQQLLVICEAINGNGKWYDDNGLGYCPLFKLYSKNDIEMLGEDEAKRNGIHNLLYSVYSSNADVAGVRCNRTDYRSASTTANFGFPMCLNSEEKAEFVGNQFFELCCQCYGLTLKSDK